MMAQWAEDWRSAWEAAGVLEVTNCGRLRMLELETKHLVQQLQDDEVWAAVAELADNLMAHETLDAEQIEEITSQWLVAYTSVQVATVARRWKPTSTLSTLAVVATVATVARRWTQTLTLSTTCSGGYGSHRRQTVEAKRQRCPPLGSGGYGSHRRQTVDAKVNAVHHLAVVATVATVARRWKQTSTLSTTWQWWLR